MEESISLLVSCDYNNITSIDLFPSFAGDNGNVFELENCNFVENSGRGTQLDFGAAVGLSFLTAFRQRVTAPRHDVHNW